MNFSLTRIQKFAWFSLVYNIFIILFGAFVRATGSGAGCGAHWPLCTGVIIPRPERIETVIEFSHRITSGITLILIVILFIWVRRQYASGSPVRKAVSFALFFTITEALVGAGLVLFKLVAYNDSLARVFSMMLHLVNTFLLLASLTLTAWWLMDKKPQGIKVRGLNGMLILIGCVLVLILSASGAVTALGDTLFPSVSLAEGLKSDLSPTAHYLIRMRIYHPGFAVSVGVYLFLVTIYLRGKINHSRIRFFSNSLFVLYFLQILIGILNVALLAPISLQIIHLLVSNLVWIFFILFSSDVLGNFSPGLSHQDIHKPVHQITG